jgi:hypothetical protein
MPVYELRSNFDLNVDGIMVPSDSVLGILTTELEVGNVLSAASFGRASAVLISAKPSAPFSRSAAEPPQPIKPDDSKIDDEQLADRVDALNAEPAEPDESDESIEPATINAEPPINPFVGLGPRIADALLAAGFKSREAVAEIAVDGADAFLELDGIGKSAARKIVEWLHE